MPESNTESQIRSLPILISYLCLAASLTLSSCQTIYCRYKARQTQNDWSTPQRRQQFFIFAALAALSLGTTWYYMFAFFAHSYRNWETGYLIAQNRELPQSIVSRLELWLRNTGLFREAWETVIETPARFWWSGQIFQWTTGWSLFLGVMGTHITTIYAKLYSWLTTHKAGDTASRIPGCICSLAKLLLYHLPKTCSSLLFSSRHGQSRRLRVGNGLLPCF